MKKIISLLIVAAMIITLAGCGKTSGEDMKNGSGTEAKGEENRADQGDMDNLPEEEPYTVAMSFITFGEAPADLKLVEEAASKLTMEKLGCKLEFVEVGVGELSNKLNLWSASGEKIDLVFLLGTDLRTMVEQGVVLPITDYMNEDYAPNILLDAQTKPFLLDGMLDGENYAIPIIDEAVGKGGGLVVRKDVLEQINFDDSGRKGYNYEEISLMTYEDLDELFEQIHDAFPELVTYGQVGAVSTETNSRYFLDFDPMSYGLASAGVLMNGGRDGNTTIVNLYETDEYREYLEWMHKWQEKGYFYGDAATTTNSIFELMSAGRTATVGVSGMNVPGVEESILGMTSYEVEVLQVKEPSLYAGSYATAMWGVSGNSKNPAKAVQVLDLLYAENGELLNLIVNGIAGTHYEVTEYSDMIIRYLDGADPSSTTYSYGAGYYGDKRYAKKFEPNVQEFFTQSEIYSEAAISNQSAIFGYSFDSSSVQNELAAIQNVMSEYLGMLEYGMCDIDETLPEFVQALKSAGIDKVIAENQSQLDAWLATGN